MPDAAVPSSALPAWRKPILLIGTCAALSLAAVAAESIVALAITLMEGVPALAAVGLSSLAGVWIVRFARLAPQGAGRLIAGSALGVGAISLLTLLLGSAGFLHRPSALIMVGVLGVLGAAAGVIEIREWRSAAPAGVTPTHWLWLLAAPFLALTAAAACLPPGVLWKEEGFAYDVLEYHLAVPKIFLTDGVVHFLPNNVYSNFPLNGEMLSLLMMHLRGDPVEAAFMAVFVNLGLAALFAAAGWWAGCAFGRQVGIISGVVAATVPWLTYLSGIAYVEPGMLAAGMASFALLLHAMRAGERSLRPFLTAGLLAGISCGFKYTAVPMIALPLAAIPLMSHGRWMDRGRRAGLLALGAWLMFAPWMIRNVINTGNPLFPLAYSVFGSREDTWSAEADAVWQHAHGSSQAEHTLAPVWQRALERTLAEPRMGWSLFVLAAIGAIRRRDRWTAVLLAVLLWQIVFWLAFTHLFARFAVVMLLPLVVLAGRSIEGLPARPAEPAGKRREPAGTDSALSTQHSALAARSIPLILVVGAATGFLGVRGTAVYGIAGLYYDHTRVSGRRLDAYGHTDWFTTGQWPSAGHWGAINALPPGSRVMLVGEARTFYLLTPFDYAVVFNRHPLAEAIERIGDPAGIIGWLGQQGFTHVLADWGEIRRLATSYGFYRALAPEVLTRLEAAGLRRAGQSSLRQGDPAYATLYEVPRP